MGQTVAGSYGVTPLGLVALSIEFTPLAADIPASKPGKLPHLPNPETQRLATAGPPNSNLTPSLIADLENGMSDVAFDDHGKPLLVCAAIDANTPVFCDSNGLAVATPAIAHLRGLYRFTSTPRPSITGARNSTIGQTLSARTNTKHTQDRLTAAVAALKTNLEQRITQLQASRSPRLALRIRLQTGATIRRRPGRPHQGNPGGV